MRILFISQYCGFFGGVEQYIADITRGLKDRGHQAFLVFQNCSSRSPDDYAAMFDRSYKVQDFSAGNPWKSESPGKILADVSPDIVFIHKIAQVGKILTICTNYPTVRMVHDHDLCCPRRHKYFFWNNHICNLPVGIQCFFDLAFIEKNPARFFKFSIKNLFHHFREMKNNRRLDCLMVGSASMKNELIMNGFARDKVRIQPPVVNLPVTDYVAPDNSCNILYVGQLIKGKGVDLLLKALSQVKSNFYLKIVGEGNAGDQLKSLCLELNLMERVEFCGWVDRARLAGFYRECLFTVVPSRWAEPFGMVGLEAMNFGRAVVGFAVGGIPDWLTHESNGLLASAGNSRALGACIDILLSNPEMAVKMGLEGLRMTRESFSFSRSLDRLEESFGEISGIFTKGRGSC